MGAVPEIALPENEPIMKMVPELVRVPPLVMPAFGQPVQLSPPEMLMMVPELVVMPLLTKTPVDWMLMVPPLLMVPPKLLMMALLQQELMVIVPELETVPPELTVRPALTVNPTPGLIVKVSPELTVTFCMVHLLVEESQVPPIAIHEVTSETVPPVAYAGFIVGIAEIKADPTICTTLLFRSIGLSLGCIAGTAITKLDAKSSAIIEILVNFTLFIPNYSNSHQNAKIEINPTTIMDIDSSLSYTHAHAPMQQDMIRFYLYYKNAL